MLDNMAGNPDAFSSYARTAHSILTALWRYSTDPEFTDLDTTPTLSPDHPVIVHLLTMNKSTVCKVLHVLEQYSISHLQRFCSRSSLSAQVFVWSYDRLLFVRCCLKAHLQLVSRYDTAPDPADRRLLVVKFSNAPGLGKVSLHSIFGDPFIVSLIPGHLRRQIGNPFLAWKSSSTIASHWHNAKRIAAMSADELSSICSNPCLCEAYHDVHKQDGHLMTTDCGVLPSESLSALGNMGAKYSPHVCPSYLNPESRSEILKVMQGAVAQFARQAEARVGTPGCMTAWQSEVDFKIAERVNQIPDGTLLNPHEALPYSPSDRRLMSEFLQNFVCTPMDKAADTFVFQCIKVYINDLVSDLEDPQGTYEMVDEHAEAWKQIFQAFVEKFNFGPPAPY